MRLPSKSVLAHEYHSTFKHYQGRLTTGALNANHSFSGAPTSDNFFYQRTMTMTPRNEVIGPSSAENLREKKACTQEEIQLY